MKNKKEDRKKKKSRKEARKRMAIARRAVFIVLTAGLLGFFVYNNLDYFLTPGDEAVAVVRAEAKRPKAEQARAEKAENKKIRAEMAQDKKTSAEAAKAEKSEAKRAGAEQARTEKSEAKRVGAEQARAEKSEAKRIRAEKAKAEKAEVKMLKAERAKRLKEEKLAKKALGKEPQNPKKYRSADDILGVTEFPKSTTPLPERVADIAPRAPDTPPPAQVDVIRVEGGAAVKIDAVDMADMAGAGSGGRQIDGAVLRAPGGADAQSKTAPVVQTANLERLVEDPGTPVTGPDPAYAPREILATTEYMSRPAVSDSERALREILALLAQESPMPPPKPPRQPAMTRVLSYWSELAAAAPKVWKAPDAPPTTPPAAQMPTAPDVLPPDTPPPQDAPLPLESPRPVAAPVPAAPDTPKTPPAPETLLLSGIECRLADRDDLRISMSLELFFNSDGLREEARSKRVLLAAVAGNVVRRYEYGSVAMPSLRADLLDSFNGLLGAKALNRVDIQGFHVELAAAAR